MTSKPTPCTDYQARMNLCGRLFGVPDTLPPKGYAEFERYVRSMVDDEVLEVGPQARTLASEVLDAGASGLAWPTSRTPASWGLWAAIA